MMDRVHEALLMMQQGERMVGITLEINLDPVAERD